MSGRADRTRRLAQHFLRSSAHAGQLVDHSTIGRADLVLEIGAGRGALTRALARRCGRLPYAHTAAIVRRLTNAEPPPPSASRVRRLARALHIAPDGPPSQLRFEQWLGLFRFFARRAGRPARARVRGGLARLPR